MAKTQVDKLEDQEFIRGRTIIISLTWNYEDKSPIDLRFSEIRFYLFPFGQYDMPVQFGDKDYKIGEISSERTNLCYIKFSPDETLNLIADHYVYQPILVVNSNEHYAHAEGDIIFRKTHP